MELHAFRTLLSGIKVSTGLGGHAAHYERVVVLEALTTEDFGRLLRGETLDVTHYVEKFYVNANGTPFHAVLS